MHPVFFTSTPLLPEVHFAASINDTTNLVFKFSDVSELCNDYNYSVPNTTNDEQIFDAFIDPTANINPLAVTIANTGYGTTTTEYYSSSDFCAYIASVNETANAADLNIYPNPATDHITIELGKIKNSPSAVVTIYDMTGRKVLESRLDSSLFMNISTSGFAPGLYTVVISDAGKMLGRQRVAIQK
jgi:hypothetical protein